ncbi:MAG: STAS domain-containing protein [Eubacteriales bacterium]
MMTIVSKQEGDMIRLTVEGRIDSNTNIEFQEKIEESFLQTKHVTIDMKDVTYISSAAIRSILIGQKSASAKDGKFVIKNASSNIKKLLDSVGLTKILTFR